MIVTGVVGGIGLDDVGAELAGLAHEGDDELLVAVHLIAALGLVGLEDERLDHERHAVVIADRAQPGGVERRLPVEIGLAGHQEEVANDAGCVGFEGRDDGLVPVDELVKHHLVRGGIVEVAHVGAEDEGGFAGTGNRLQDVRLPDVHLDGVGTGLDEGTHDSRHVFEPIEEGVLVEDAVVDGDVETAAVSGEEAIEADFVRGEHGGERSGDFRAVS